MNTATKGFVFTLAIFGLEVSCATLSPADKVQIAKDQIELSVCAVEAHDCKLDDAGSVKCWAVFDACMVRKGFYDVGSDAR
jgi:hypothetical protein